MFILINDNYCVPKPVLENRCSGTVTNNLRTLKSLVNYCAVSHVPSATKNVRQPQKKGLSPPSEIREINSVNCVSFVDQCVCAPSVSNAHNVVHAPQVGGRLQPFWQTWALLGANPRVVSILKDGYILPFKIRPPLVRDPLIVSGYANPTRNLYLEGALQALRQKEAVEMVRVRTSLAFFNRLFIVPKPNQKWRPILDLSALNKFLSVKTFKMETPETIRLSLQKGEWVTSLDFSDAYFHIPVHVKSRKYLRFHSVQGSSLWPLHSSNGVHLCGQRGQVNGSIPGYKNPPVPRRLVDSSPYQRILPPGHSIPPRPLPGVGLDSQPPKVRTRTQTDFRVRGLQVRSLSRTGLTDSEQVGFDPPKVGIHSIQTELPSQEIYVPDRPSYSDGKTGSPGETPHETHPVAPKTTLESSRIPGKGDSCSKVAPPTPSMVDQRDKCLARTVFAPLESCRTNLYRRLKRRLGCSLRRLHSKRRLVSSRKSSSHKFPGTKSGLTGLEKVPALGTRQSSSSCHRQHHSCGIHQQGRRYEVRLTLCPSMETPVLVQSEAGSVKGQAHPWSSQCDCRQAVSSRPSHSDGMVTSPGGLRPPSSDLAPAPSGHVCNKIQLQTSPVRVSSAGPECMGSGRPNSLLGELGHVCFSPSVVTGQGGQQTVGPSLQESDPHSSGLAQHAMVLGPGGTVVSDPSLPTQSSRPSDTAIQQGASQESDQSKPTRLAPRAEAIKEQGFSSPVASRIEAPQRSSTRTVYEAKWAVFVRWCESSQVDFRSPSVKQIADFLLHLFQEKNLQPSTIDGYRSAIADKLGNSSLNVSKDENLTRLLDSFHRDRPKGRRGIPSWNLSLVLHQLTKPPFEPLRKASLKHLTFKTVFLLALGSGKRRSEIHAWLNKNIRHQADWSKVSLYPSPMFLAKNHLAKEGPECVAPVVIPALAPTLDKSLKEDRSLCPVRALRYYLDKTQDVRQGKELVFVSFKKGFTKDISPATISSWIKQTVILCYDLSDQESLTLHQVKAHDVRAFAASKAFQGGISLDQILAACHWKSHNTFTQFYLKDVAWADSELFHLGPVVAAQQIHQ